MLDEYKKIVSECADQGKSLSSMLANDGILESLYLYYSKSEPGKSGKLYLVRDSAPVPNGCVLVTGEGLRCNIPYDNYFTWIESRARHCPILAY